MSTHHTHSDLHSEHGALAGEHPGRARNPVVKVRDLRRAPVEVGCRIELREGCDKRFETCVSRFANAINFRGEPHLPGNDLLTRYPGA